MTTTARVGILGGTLDPIHLGHLDAALAAREAMSLDCVYVLPSGVPPHRAAQPAASAYHRFAMVALAVNGVDGLRASDLELTAPAGPSYTASTLERFRQRTNLARTQIFFITGADAFAEIETWHRYPDVLDLSHFVVVSRPGFPVSALPRALPGLAARMTEAGAHADRERTPAVFTVDAATRDVSSTTIRQRLAAGGSLNGLVPARVEAHILQHGLYVGAPSSSSADHLHVEN
jgi:nicotinate-nucleotide adenylyltransferase